MKLEEAEHWLWGNASEDDKELNRHLQAEAMANIPHIYPKDPDMWGPNEYLDWSHEALVWRLVFLQCALRRLHTLTQKEPIS